MDGLFRLSEISEDSCHVLGNLSVNSEKVGEIEAAERTGIPPGEQEAGNTSALTRVATGDVQQLFESKSEPTVDAVAPFRRRCGLSHFA